MRLIDADALLKQIEVDSKGQEGYYGDNWKFIDTINAMPSAERTGKWIWENYVWHCDQCGKNPTHGTGYVQRKEELFDFCPHCGVGMVKE